MKHGIDKVVKYTSSPLHYFLATGLGLLVAVCFLAWKSTLPPFATIFLICFLLMLAFGLVGFVAFLVLQHPKKLTFDKEAHIRFIQEGLSDNELPLRTSEEITSPGAVVVVDVKSKTATVPEKESQ